jgi:hypothetical protein
MDGEEYAYVPATLLMNFWKPGTTLYSDESGMPSLTIFDNELTLMSMIQDLTTKEP